MTVLNISEAFGDVQTQTCQNNTKQLYNNIITTSETYTRSTDVVVKVQEPARHKIENIISKAVLV